MQRVQAARSPECAKNRQTHKPFLLLEIFISGVGGRAGACPNQVEYDPIAALPTPSPRGLSWPCPGELVRPAPHSPVGTRWQPPPPSLNSTTPPPMVRMRPTHPLLRAQGEAELRVCLHDRRPRGRPRALESPVPGPPGPRARPPRAPACCPHSVRFDLRPRSRPHPSAAPRPRRLSASQLARNPALSPAFPDMKMEWGESGLGMFVLQTMCFPSRQCSESLRSFRSGPVRGALSSLGKQEGFQHRAAPPSLPTVSPGPLTPGGPEDAEHGDPCCTCARTSVEAPQWRETQLPGGRQRPQL